MTRANDSVLDELHGLQAKTLLSEIKGYLSRREPVPPALFAQANKFLKDNGIDRAIVPGDPTSLLEEEVPLFDNVVKGDFR